MSASEKVKLVGGSSTKAKLNSSFSKTKIVQFTHSECTKAAQFNVKNNRTNMNLVAFN